MKEQKALKHSVFKAMISPHGFSFQLDTMGIVNETIKDSVSNGWVWDGLMPDTDRELTCDER